MAWFILAIPSKKDFNFEVRKDKIEILNSLSFSYFMDFHNTLKNKIRGNCTNYLSGVPNLTAPPFLFRILHKKVQKRLFLSF